MDKPCISLNEVLKNELFKTCSDLAYRIMQDIGKREGFDINKNNYHLSSDKEKVIMDISYVLNDIVVCLSSIENACIFMKRFYGKEYFEKKQINLIDYSLYHYDVFCHKISTIKDLYFKLISLVYDLKLERRSCNWKTIEKNEKFIGNDFLFHLLREYYKYLHFIEDRRNKSTHEGKMEHDAFKDIAPYVLFTMYAKTTLTCVNEDFIITRGSDLELKLKTCRKKFLEEVEICRYNVFVFTRCILCSMTEQFLSMIDKDIKTKYSETIKNMNQNNINDENCYTLKCFK